MPDLSRIMQFTFIEEPAKISPGEDQTPTFKVDTSSLSLTLQAFLLRVLPLLTITAKNDALSYIFETAKD